ncbi:GspH/FimT family pseudopilin [Iodobacter sp.]|uniref:GspH/FimT family pseudopilin n=1 Tax=Iodobacter sp. TaxID=1915058 RepID=UPI0025E73232|nr:GspH/FimT family pseudopilin [Iodobacter sp.]
MNRKLHPKPQAGFTLIELMITLLIFGILLALAGPPFQSWVKNTQLRSYAESFQSAVQQARSEAIKRNGYVELLLTNSAISAVGRNAAAITESTQGTAWLIRGCPDCVNLNAPPAIAKPSYPYIEGKTVSEGNSAKFTLNANQSLIRFDALGRTNRAFSLIVADKADEAKLGACTKADGKVITGPARICLLVDEGGNARLCLPDAVSSNPSSCVR